MVWRLTVEPSAANTRPSLWLQAFATALHEVLNIEQGTAPFVLCDVGARWAHTYEMRGSEGLPGVGANGMGMSLLMGLDTCPDRMDRTDCEHA